jgi:hypothetical protein
MTHPFQPMFMYFRRSAYEEEEWAVYEHSKPAVVMTRKQIEGDKRYTMAFQRFLHETQTAQATANQT